MINEVDYHDNQLINYSEFLAATIDSQKFLTESRLRAIFNQFDTDSSGKITKENIGLAMQKLGKNIDEVEINQMIKQHDITGDGMLSFDEFKHIFCLDVDDDTPEEHTYEALGPEQKLMGQRV